MTIVLWPTKREIFPGFAGHIEEFKKITVWHPTALGTVFGLVLAANVLGLSDNWMSYRVSFKAVPPEGAHSV